MLNVIKNKAVIVTAGGSGIGRAIAERFHHYGARVFICDIDEQAINATVSANEGMLGGVANVGDSDSVDDFFNKAIEQLGTVDVLVNNAGIAGPRKAIEDISNEEWDQTIQINLSGMFYCTRNVVPVMKKNRSGCIVNISTVNAKLGLPQRIPYVASKAGVVGFSYNLARELGEFGIRSNTILPGPVDTPRCRHLINLFAKDNGLAEEDAMSEFLKFQSLGELIQPEDIGNTAVFLASDGGRRISGQELRVCGNMEWEG